ncbi:MAG: hypothetical protein H0V70_22445 [Ktedonobacteraceae bacterium]|nr:hypothetical protein [Ktedonobacteraceae bacterium]
MGTQLLPSEEFFIYVPLLHTEGPRVSEQDSREENTLSQTAHEDWIQIPLAERVVVYAHVCGEEEQGQAPLYS